MNLLTAKGRANFIKAMITANDREDAWGHLLKHMKAVVFFGVPHRGADVAYWADS